MKSIKKIFFLFVIIISLIIVREFFAIYNDLISINIYLGYLFILLVIIVVIYFVILPIIAILKIPKTHAPTKNIDEKDFVLRKRLKQFEENKLLDSDLFTVSESDQTKYDNMIRVLEDKTRLARNNYVSKIFYSTAVSQNGFLDAIIILSASIGLIKEIFIIYNGRVSNKDLLAIGRKIYTAVAIAGSEGVEYASDEIITSLASDSLQSIPFIDKIMSSIADGFVNAMLITRISFIAENYCKLLYIKSDKDLTPSFKSVYNTAKIITNDVREKIKATLTLTNFKRKENFALLSVNPAGYVFDLTIKKFGEIINMDSGVKNAFSNTVKTAISPFLNGFEKIAGLFKIQKHD